MQRIPTNTTTHVFGGRADSQVFFRFENTIVSCINPGRRAGSRQLCLMSCVVALWSARTCFAALCKADGLCCDVLAVDARIQHVFTHKIKAPQKHKKAHLLKQNEIGKRLAGK